MIKILILGAAGKMGKRLVVCSSNYPDIKIVGGIEQPGNPSIGKDIGEVAGTGSLSAKISDSLDAIIAGADVCIDFSHHTSTVGALPVIIKHKKALVICTTGFDESEKAKINEASKSIPILFSPNMSVGVNLLFDLDAGIHRFKLPAEPGNSGQDAQIIQH